MKQQFLADMRAVYKLYEASMQEHYTFYKVLQTSDFATYTEQRNILHSLCQKLDIESSKEHYMALIDRIVGLREDSILEVLKGLNKSTKEVQKAREILLDFVSTYYTMAHSKLLHHIESANLLTPFYREILYSVHRVGQCMNEFFKVWNKELIHTINIQLSEIFSFQEALQRLESTIERDSFGHNAQRSYSLPCYPNTKITRDTNFSSIAYVCAFPKEVGAIIDALKISIENLYTLEDDVFKQKDAYIAYFIALKNAWECKESIKLIESWQAVDLAWMRIDTPLQVGHPLEYYEDIYRHAVAPEWDLRFSVNEDNKGIYATNVRDNITKSFRFLADRLEYGVDCRAFVEHSLKQSSVYESVPLLFYGAENNGLFSAQVVPNDEFVSKKEGKKIFAFPLRIIAQARAKPQMRLHYEFFSKDFLAQGRDILFYNENLWHSIYDISTNGHEFGHILWIDENTEEIMNVSGEFKNIEEFKATSGGIIAYLLESSPIAEILKKSLKKIQKIDMQQCMALIQDIESKDKQIWEAFFRDCIKRAVGLMAWRENLEVRPYYCEGIIHLCGMFQSGVLKFEQEREFAKLIINEECYVNLALWYVDTYLSLVRHYIEKKDAKIWLERFCINEQARGVRVKESEVAIFVAHYFERYTAIGQEIYDEDLHI